MFNACPGKFDTIDVGDFIVMTGQAKKYCIVTATPRYWNINRRAKQFGLLWCTNKLSNVKWLLPDILYGILFWSRASLQMRIRSDQPLKLELAMNDFPSNLMGLLVLTVMNLLEIVSAVIPFLMILVLSALIIHIKIYSYGKR